MSGPVKRPYDSTRRQRQAKENRRRIIRAAKDLFITLGYGQTTLVQIAEAAEVSVETVYAAFRNKRGLLRRVWFFESRGDEEEVTLYDRTEMQAILAEPDLASRIRKHAEFVTTFNHRMAPLLAALTGAAASEPEAVAMLAEWSERLIDVATKIRHGGRRHRAAGDRGGGVPRHPLRDDGRSDVPTSCRRARLVG